MTTDASPPDVDLQAEARALSNAATAAGHAPSIHNTQPWRWRLVGNELNLYLDHSRSLEVTDPDSRLAVLSCGAALHHALVSLAADGWHTILARIPSPAHPDHLAQLRLDHRIAVEPTAIRHRQTLDLRHTDRRPTTGTPVDADKLRSIAAAVESAGSGLHLLRPDQVYDLAAATDRAQRTEAGEAAWQAELGYWTGGTRPLGSGIPDAAIGDRATQTTVPGRDFGHDGDLPISEAHENAATYGILYGTEDGPARLAPRRRSTLRRLAHRHRTRHIRAAAERNDRSSCRPRTPATPARPLRPPAARAAPQHGRSGRHRSPTHAAATHRPGHRAGLTTATDTPARRPPRRGWRYPDPTRRRTA